MIYIEKEILFSSMTDSRICSYNGCEIINDFLNNEKELKINKSELEDFLCLSTFDYTKKYKLNFLHKIFKFLKLTK